MYAIRSYYAAAEGYEAKEEAIRTLLAARPGSNPPGTLENKDNGGHSGEVDWESIDSLPHNREVDQNL